MKVTAIIPVHNRAKLVVRAINSLLAQSSACDLDILVVDDGSTDETPVVLASLAQKHPEVRVVSRPNGGVTEARNTGVANLHSDTEIVTFLDSDDVCAPGRFKADLPLFFSDDCLEVTYGRMIVTDKIDPLTCAPTADSQIAEIVGPHLTSGLFRRSVFNRVGHFDPDFVQSEDVDFLFRVFEANTKFVQTDTLCFYYLRHQENMTNAKKTMYRYFALAVLKSIRRRKANPAIRMNRPTFDIRALLDVRLF